MLYFREILQLFVARKLVRCRYNAKKIAAENNLAETAFTVPVENGYEIRWFTPEVEVDLCGSRNIGFPLYIDEF